MRLEVLIVLWIGIFAFFSNQRSIRKIEYNNNIYAKKYSDWVYIVALLPVILWAGFRSGRGYADTNAYISLYSILPTSLSGLKDYLCTINKDVGFYVFAGAIKLFFKNNYTPFLLIIAIIQGWALIKFYKNHSIEYVTSIFLFIISADYFAWMFNGIRQFLAVSIIYLAMHYLIYKKYIRFILVVLLAATVHQSALIMIPICFIVQGEAWNRKTVFTILIALFAIVYTDRFMGVLEMAMEDTQYSANMAEMELQAGVNVLRVAVYSVPAVLSFIGRRYLKEYGKNNPILNISINMSVITMALYLIGMTTSGIMIGRLPIYTSLFNYILLPYELQCLFNYDSRKIVRLIMVACYLLYYYYLMHVAYGRI